MKLSFFSVFINSFGFILNCLFMCLDHYWVFFFLLIRKSSLHVLCLLGAVDIFFVICAMSFHFLYVFCLKRSLNFYVLCFISFYSAIICWTLLCTILAIGYVAVSKGNKNPSLHEAYHSSWEKRKTVKHMNKT